MKTKTENILFSAALALYILSFSFETIVKTRILGNNVLFPEACFLVLAIVFGIAYFHQLPHFFHSLTTLSRIDKALSAYVLVQILAAIVTPSGNAIGEILAVFYLFSLYSMVRWHLLSYGDIFQIRLLKSLIISVLLGNVFALTFYIAAHFTENPVFIWHYKNYPAFGTTFRATGFWRNPTFFAEFVVLGICCVAWAYKSVSLRFWQRVCLPTLVLSVCALYASKDKATLIFAGSILFFLPFYYKNLSLFFKVSCRILGVTILIFYIFYAHFLIYKNLENSPFKLAEHVWEVPLGNTTYYVQSTPYYNLKKLAAQVFLENPIFGVGGNNLITHSRQQWQRYDIVGDIASAPHSTYFGSLADLGILGFAVVLWLFWQLWRTAQQQFNGFEQFFWRIFLLSFFAIGVCHDTLNGRQYWLVFAILSTRQLEFKLKI